MSPEERQLITSLFERIHQASSAPREPEAEALIADGVKRAPHAPYVMAQAVIIQEEALKAASKRIEELETKLRDLENKPQSAQSGSFLGGMAANLFGGGRSATGIPSVSAAAPPPPQQQAGSVWNRGGAPVAPAAPPSYAPQPGYGQPQAAAPAGSGSSFLGNALATAAGVAGGALLYDGLRSAFGGHGSSLLGGGLMGSSAPASTTSITENYYIQNAAQPAASSLAQDAFPASAPLPPERPAFEDAIQPASYESEDGGGFFGGSSDFSGSGDDSDWA